jgi:hypothetical protein
MDGGGEFDAIMPRVYCAVPTNRGWFAMLLVLNPGMGWMPAPDGRLPAGWAALAVCCALAAVGIWIVWRMPRRTGTTEPACGRCGYFVTGLSGNVCPECGSDLRAVGVITPGGARQAPARLKLATMVLLLPLPLVFGWQLVRPVLPKRFGAISLITLAQPKSDAYRRIRIEGLGQRWAVRPPEQMPRTDISIRVTRPAAHDLYYYVDLENPVGATRTVDFGDGRTYAAPLEHDAQGVNAEALLDWLARDAGFDASDPELQGEMQALAVLVQTMMRGGSVTAVAGPNWSNVSAGGGMSPTMPLWMLACWAGLWLLLALFLARRILRRATLSDTQNAERPSDAASS